MANDGSPLPAVPLNGPEIAALLRAKLRQAGGGAFDVVDVAIREDGIHLCGDVASERDRSLARKIVEEELGRSDVVDRLRVDPCLWKRGEDEPRQGVDPEDAV